MTCQEPHNEWLPRLDEELSRLPRHYRSVIVVCDLEGKTRQQAAQQLGWPEGTVAGRLARARALLAKRMLRGAQVFSATDIARAALPADVVHSTIHAAGLVAAGNRTADGVLSSAALTLAKGVMQTMFWNKVKIAGVLLVAAIVIAGVGGGTVHMLRAQEKQTQQGGDKAGQAKADQDKAYKEAERAAGLWMEAMRNQAATERYKALLKAAQDQWDGQWKRYQESRTATDFVLPWSVNLLKARLKFCVKKSEVVAAHEEHLKRMKEVEAISKALYDANTIIGTDYHQCVYYRIEAEIWLEEAKAAK